MKKPIIVGLVCVNVGLVLALFFGTGAPTARAQGFGPVPNYLVTTGQYGEDLEILYVVDLDTGRMAAWAVGLNQKGLVAVGARDLNRDFR